MRILIVNRFMPPDEAPTSVLAGELAEHLQQSGHEVECIASSTDYRGGKRSGLLRIAGEMVSHLQLMYKMLTARRADLLLCLSSPTCLAVTAAIAATIRRTRFAHWAMDVYPEVAVRLGEINEGGIAHCVTEKLMNWAYRRTDVLVALDEDMQQLLASKGHVASVCRPWTPLALQWPETDDCERDLTQPLRWVYSGNLGRAHEWESLLDAQKILEDECPGEFELIFQGGGANRLSAQARASELTLQHCRWNDYAPKDALLTSLFEADVLVATQNPATQGLLWPSKLAVMRHVPRPILWVGPKVSAVTNELSSRPLTEAIEIGPHAARRTADWLKSLRISAAASQTTHDGGSNRVEYTPPRPQTLQQPIASLEEILLN
ncbi:MAG: colanic acid biosynthesis glycosyl transferase WcaI [Verrucomicrobiales bacterium]|jgi:colanic acid biosynthesis glycosyl transferase WcaI